MGNQERLCAAETTNRESPEVGEGRCLNKTKASQTNPSHTLELTTRGQYCAGLSSDAISSAQSLPIQRRLLAGGRRGLESLREQKECHICKTRRGQSDVQPV